MICCENNVDVTLLLKILHHTISIHKHKLYVLPFIFHQLQIFNYYIFFSLYLFIK